MNGSLRFLVLALMIACTGAAAGCSRGKRPYDTPRARLDGDQAVALLQRDVERRMPRRTFSKAERVATQTSTGTYAWLVRLSDRESGALCGYVWRGEEAGRADGTVIRIRYDGACRHWND